MTPPCSSRLNCSFFPPLHTRYLGLERRKTKQWIKLDSFIPVKLLDSYNIMKERFGRFLNSKRSREFPFLPSDSYNFLMVFLRSKHPFDRRNWSGSGTRPCDVTCVSCARDQRTKYITCPETSKQLQVSASSTNASVETGMLLINLWFHLKRSRLGDAMRLARARRRGWSEEDLGFPTDDWGAGCDCGRNHGHGSMTATTNFKL